MRVSPDGREVSVKVAITGAAGSGKLKILQAIAERQGGHPVQAETLGAFTVHRTAWVDRDCLERERELHVSLVTLSGKVDYNAAEELLLREADAILFVVDVDPNRLREAWEALLRVSDNAQRNGYELRSVPLALQYHRADRHPDFEPAKLDDWLGVPADEVPRFITSSRSPDLEGMAFDSVMTRLIGRINEL